MKYRIIVHKKETTFIYYPEYYDEEKQKYIRFSGDYKKIFFENWNNSFYFKTLSDEYYFENIKDAEDFIYIYHACYKIKHNNTAVIKEFVLD